MTRRVFSGRSVSARGSSMLEFVLAVALVVLPLISGILEFAQLATARHILAFATQEAARSEAIAAMDERSNIVRLDALVASFFDAAGTRSVDDSLRLSFARGLLPLFGGDFASGVEPVKGLEQWQLALAEVSLPNRLRVVVKDSVLQTADIEVGLVEATYCRELFFVPASLLIPELMALWTTDSFELACLEAGRVPIAAIAPMSRSRFP
ncbi:MAG: pilus assembly protein [Gammaproteobacteria bacterium]|jgi:TadE-like protein|nr:pilus assembly protein [Gammaproteobacteria bacterium]